MECAVAARLLLVTTHRKHRPGELVGVFTAVERVLSLRRNRFLDFETLRTNL
jgi:hypothetical protein